MKTLLGLALAFVTLPAFCHAAVVVHAVHGTIDTIGEGGKTVVVKTVDGSKYILNVIEKTSVYGFDAGVAGAKATAHGIHTGAEVVAHYSVEGTTFTALTVRKVGATGLHATEGTVSAIDSGAKKIALKTSDGAVHTYALAENATVTASKAGAKGIATGAKVIVYSTETAGNKIAHFVRAL